MSDKRISNVTVNGENYDLRDKDVSTMKSEFVMSKDQATDNTRIAYEASGTEYEVPTMSDLDDYRKISNVNFDNAINLQCNTGELNCMGFYMGGTGQAQIVNQYAGLLETTGTYFNWLQPVARGVVQQGNTAYIQAAENKFYLIFTGNWTVGNSMGLYAAMITSGKVVTKIAASDSVTVSVHQSSSGTWYIDIASSNLQTYYWVYSFYS